jgi:hypothetical protein
MSRITLPFIPSHQGRGEPKDFFMPRAAQEKDGGFWSSIKDNTLLIKRKTRRKTI